MFVFRIEDVEHRGPYKTSHSCGRDLCNAHNGSESHPVAWLDVSWRGTYSDYSDGSWLCGFKDEEDMRIWFKGWIKKLNKAGYFVVKYKVPKKHVRFGSKQVIFVKENAQIVEKIPYCFPRKKCVV